MIDAFRRRPWRLVLLATWGAWFAGLWPQWFVVNQDGIWAGQPFIWADWSAHLTYVSRFRYTPIAQWFAHHPIYATERWTYPPLPNLISAMLAKLGLPLGPAMLIPVILATAALLWLLYEWFLRHKLSERAAFTGVSLFLLSGSWGWWLWLEAVLKNGSSEILFPSRLYTQVFDHFLVWLNPIAGMVLPQRSFLIGFPLLLWILIRIRQVVEKPVSAWREPLILAVSSAVLFLTHTHSFFALGVLCTVWFFAFWSRWKFWLRFGLATTALIFPWYWFVLRGSGALSSFSIDLGWMSPEPFNPLVWVWFWLKNWGFTLPLALLGFWHSSSAERRWSSAFFALFLLANIVRTQSYDWDNAKLLIVVLLGLLPLVLLQLHRLLRLKPSWLGRAVVVMVVIFSIWGGVLEAIRVSQPNRTFWQMAGPVQLQFASAVRAVVPPDQVVLTSDLHNHPVPMLAGRPVLLGYVGWVWSYGFHYDQIQRDVRAMYADASQSRTLRKQYGIRFVVVGPHETEQFNGTIFPQRECQQTVEVGDYILWECQ